MQNNRKPMFSWDIQSVKSRRKTNG